MEGKIGEFFDYVGNFFTGGDHLPWCDSDAIASGGTPRKYWKLVCYVSKISSSSSQILLSHSLSPVSAPALWNSSYALGCEREVAEAEKHSSDELRSESIMHLSWALVHSKHAEDVQRGIAMLEASLPLSDSPLKASTLKKAIEAKITKDGVIGIGIAATAVGLLAGGIAAALSTHKK